MNNLKYNNNYNIGFFKRLKLLLSDQFFGNIIVEEKFSKSIIFYLKIVLLLSLVVGVITFMQSNSLSSIIGQRLQEDVPDFEFINGKLVVDGDMPIRISEDDMIFVIDTSGGSTINDLKPTVTNKPLTFIDSEGISFYDPKGELNPLGENLSFETLGEINLTKSDIVDTLSNSNMLAFILTFVSIFAFIAHKVINPLYLFLIAKIISLVKKINVSNLALLALVLYALTVPNFLHLIASTVGFSPSIFHWIYMGVGVFFIVRFFNNLGDSSIDINV